MKGYALTDVFNRHDLTALKLAQIAVRVLPDRIYTDLVRCHELARVVADGVLKDIVPGARCVDGHFDGVEHSWVAWIGKDGVLRILDPYSVGSLPQVQLHHRGVGIRRHDFRPDHMMRVDVREGVLFELRTLWRDYVDKNPTLIADINMEITDELAF